MAQNAWPGPDNCGYTGKNSNDAGGPNFNWVDITTVGTEITGLGDDNTVGPIQMGFNFRYYWVDVNKFFVCSNGYVSFANHTISSGQDGFYPTPTQDANNNFVAPLLSDLKFDGAGNPAKAYYYVTPGADSLIVSFYDVPWWVRPEEDANEWAGSNTFQVILTNTDSSVTFQYLEQSGSWSAAYDGTTYPAVIGIENITGTVGLMHSANMLMPNETAIKFYMPSELSCSVLDVMPITVNQSDRNGGLFTYRNIPTARTSTVANVGNTSVTTAFNVINRLKRPNNQIITGSGNTKSVASLAVAEETDVVFDNLTAANVSTKGYYFIETVTQLSGDQNTTNNTLRTELVILDTIGVEYDTLRFFNPASLATQSVGTFGLPEAGMSFTPPFYPFTITGLRFHSVAQDCAGMATNDVTMSIFDDNGANGTPGTQLASETVLTGDIFMCDFTSIELSAPLVITEGSFYVLWQPVNGEQNIFLTTDVAIPASLRTYEVNNGAWGIYRSFDTEDFFIDVVYGNPYRVLNVAQVDGKRSFNVSQNYPNPSKDATSINVSLDKASDVTITVANVIGQVMSNSTFNGVAVGTHKFDINTNALESGVYFYTVKAGNNTITKKMTISK
jgi:hypothetical protein